MKTAIALVLSLVVVSGCKINHTHTKSFVNSRITADCVDDFLNQGSGLAVDRHSLTTAFVEFESAIIAVIYRNGKLEVSGQSKSQTEAKYQKKGALAPVVTELADKIRDSCVSKKG